MNKEKQRDPFFDNARFILVFLVVLGHFSGPVRNHYPIIAELNNMLGLFRMPALIIITGFLSKGFLKPGYIEKVTKRILIPYLIFQFGFAYYYFQLYDRASFNVDLLNPQYTLWFLLSLFIWNMLLFVFTRIKYPLLIAVFIGVMIGYSDGAGHYFSLHRTFTFFPFFLLGFYMKKEHFYWVKVPKAKIFGIIGFIVVWIALGQLFTTNEAQAWILGRTPYEAMGYIRWDIGLGRILIYILSLIVGFAFLSFVPKKKTFFTDLGARTAYVYILHGAIIRTLYEYYLRGTFSEPWHYMMLIVYSLILTFFLASKPVKIVMQLFIEGKIVDVILAPVKKIHNFVEVKYNTKYKQKLDAIMKKAS